MRIALDMTWLKPMKSGGVEFYALNLINGIIKSKDNNKYFILTANDNDEYIKEKINNDIFTYIKCNTYANSVKQHLYWQNLHQYRILKKLNIDVCHFMVFEMPLYKCKRIKSVTNIHDIQAMHYPEYFSKFENMWFRFAWKRVLKIADKVIGISDFTCDDLRNNFKHKDNIETIYIPVTIDDKIETKFSDLSKQYNIKKNNYYYTVISMHKHKNLITLINMMEHIKRNKIKGIPNKLVVSGVGGPVKDKLLNIIKEKDLEDTVIVTGFVSNSDRNLLIKNSNCFLFPSVFEGFGMPPIEALGLGARVVTTNKASLKEVTKGKCVYVEDPYNIDEWIDRIKYVQTKEGKVITFKDYEPLNIARKYIKAYKDVYKK